MSLDNTKLQYAGEFVLETCTLSTVSGVALDITDLVTTINVYEDLYANAITGDISLLDTNNLITKAPIVGQEKLLLKVYTPQEGIIDRNNAIEFLEFPLQIFKINSKIQLNDNTIVYNLAFTSYEFTRNVKTRAVSNYSGEPSKIVRNIFRDNSLINSKKELYHEETANNFNLVAPYTHPFDFINNIAKRSLSKKYGLSSSFVFYETTKGYFFRSIDSMMDRKNPVMVYKEVSPNEVDETGDINIAENMTNLLNHEVVSTTNTLKNSKLGAYGSSLVSIDLFNKTVKNYTYNYINDYDNTVHADQYNAYGSERSPVLSLAKDEDNNRLSEYPDAVRFIQTTDRHVPDGLFNSLFDRRYDYNGIDRWIMRRRSKFASLDASIKMRIAVPGNTVLQVGDLIGLEMRSEGSEKDPYLTGRYLITKLRHEFDMNVNSPRHTVMMEIVRDTISQYYPAESVSLNKGKSKNILLPSGDEDSTEVRF